MTRDNPLDAFDDLFDDELTEVLAREDQLTERLVAMVEDGLAVYEAILEKGSDDQRLSALSKILPLATKVADKRQDAMVEKIAATMRQMFTEIFPDHQQLDDEMELDDDDDG